MRQTQIDRSDFKRAVIPYAEHFLRRLHDAPGALLSEEVHLGSVIDLAASVLGRDRLARLFDVEDVQLIGAALFAEQFVQERLWVGTGTDEIEYVYQDDLARLVTTEGAARYLMENLGESPESDASSTESVSKPDFATAAMRRLAAAMLAEDRD